MKDDKSSEYSDYLISKNQVSIDSKNLPPEPVFPRMLCRLYTFITDSSKLTPTFILGEKYSKKTMALEQSILLLDVIAVIHEQ